MTKKEFKEKLINMGPVEIYQYVLSEKYIKKFPKYFWEKLESLEYAREILKWLIEEKLGWTDEEIKKNYSAQLLKDNKLSGMFKTLFDNSSYSVINFIYPNKFKPWEFKHAPKNFWNQETMTKAIKWLIEDKLKLLDEQILEISCQTFIDHGLWGLIGTFFRGYSIFSYRFCISGPIQAMGV